MTTVPDIAGRDLDRVFRDAEREADALAAVPLDDDMAEVLAFVRKAGPVIDELVEALPALRSFAALGAQLQAGGTAGLLGMVGSLMRSGS